MLLTTSTSTSNGHSPVEVRCAFCHGNGRDPFGVMSWRSSCCVCLGRGSVTVATPYERCAHCDGTGAVKTFSCTVCRGKGVIPTVEGPTAVCPDCGGTGDCRSAPAMDCLRCRGRGRLVRAALRRRCDPLQDNDLQGTKVQHERLLDTLPPISKSSSIGVALLDQNGTVIAVNNAGIHPGLANMIPGEGFGLGSNYLRACQQARVGCSAEFAKAVHGVRAVLAGELAECAVEYSSHSPNQQQWFQLVVTRLHGLQGAVILDVNVTDAKCLQEQLRHAQKMEAIGRLAGGMAHDFNNLLTVITGYGELVLRRMPHDDPSHEQINAIRKSAERAALLTRQLLAFSRKQVFAPVVLKLNDLVTETEKMLRRLIGEDIDLTTILDPGLGLVKADPSHLEQVIMNLAVNARDAMPLGGTLVLSTRNTVVTQTQKYAELQPGPYAMLEVKDTGCGMDAETKAHLFEPFFTTKEMGKGSGLGLATVYGIIKQSSGHIEVQSELGRGSTFRIYLPEYQGALPLRKSDQGTFKIPQGIETVLLVEDDDSVRALVSIILNTSGYTVLESRNGEEAILMCEKNEGPIHLLLTDVVMPQINGSRLADCLVSLRPGLKVLYLSGYPEEALVRYGVVKADTPFLQKPFSPAGLARKLREILG